MTEIVLIGGTPVFTELAVHEVRDYLQRGINTGTIRGYLESGKTTEILIAVQSILYIKN